MIGGRSTAHLRTSRLVEGTARAFLVVQHGSNPTTEYYLEPRLPRALTRYAEFTESARGIEPRPGEFVIFCRYVSREWLDWVDLHRRRLAGSALFLDDDFDAVVRSNSAPLGYRWRIFRNHHMHLSRMARSIDELWVSTKVLASRYGEDACITLPAVPPELPQLVAGVPQLRMVYHATRIHRPELLWVLPTMCRVLEQVEEARCEVIGFLKGDYPAVENPRLTFLNQLPWPEYKQHARRTPADLGFAPLLPNALNEARSCAKVFDYARLGAVGLYSRSPAFKDVVEDGTSGASLPLDPQLWEETAVELLRNWPRRSAMRSAMRSTLAARRVEMLSDCALLKRLMGDRNSTCSAD